MNCFLKIVLCVVIIQMVLEDIQCNFIFPRESSHYIGDNCIIVYDKNITSIGICRFVGDCVSIKWFIENKIRNHTVCGFRGFDQVVCCPDSEMVERNIEHINEPVEDVALIYSPRSFNFRDFNAGFDCILNDNFDRGVLKFVKDCPEYNESVVLQDVCDFSICADLVCCPVKRSQKLKPKCSFVDDPVEEIRTRLHLGLSCTVKGTLDIGRLQYACDAFTSDQHTDPNLYACNNYVCEGWYCCPIRKPTDKIYCIRPDSLDLTSVNFVGPKCIDSKSGRPGTCRLPVDCPGYNNDLDVCGAHCCVNFYCCPDVNFSNAPVSQQMCVSYLGAAYKEVRSVKLSFHRDSQEACSGINLPVAGGSPSKPGEYPHMAALGYIPDGDIIYWNCGGSLISDRYILSAAHCLSPKRYGSVKLVRVGAVLLNKYNHIGDCPEDYNVLEVFPHPAYNSKMTYNDIGLIRLNRYVQFNFNIRPICLPGSPEIPQYLFGMGWGIIGPLEEKSESLVQVELEQYTYKECNLSYLYDINRRFPNGILEETQMCVGSRSTIGSLCSGDSGGPLLNVQGALPRMHTVYAITSFGKICGFVDTPGVYTKVYPYIKWIESIVWNGRH